MKGKQKPPEEAPFPRNIYDEFGYIIDERNTEDQTIPEGLTFAVIKGLEVYYKTNNEEQAVRTKEAYRIADFMERRNVSVSEQLYEAAQEFETGNIENGKRLCQSVANKLTRPHNTELDAINALAD